jgi:hypothetical protein
MDPSWSEIKRIMRRHEDIFEGPRMQLREYTANFKNVDQMIKALFQRTKSFEKESQQTSALEHTIAMLLQRLDSLEQSTISLKLEKKRNEKSLN